MKFVRLGKILEPANPQGAYRFIAGVGDDMGGLVVVAIKLMSGGYAMLLHEANAAHRVSMQQLLVCRHDLGSELIVAGAIPRTSCPIADLPHYER